MRNVWGAVAAVALLLCLTYVLFDRLTPGDSWDRPVLHLDSGHPPLFFFEKLSIHDPGMVRVLLRVIDTNLQPLRQPLSTSVRIEGELLRGTLVPFVQVWDHEHVIEIRIPLPQGWIESDGRRVSKGPASAAQGKMPILLRVESLDRTFALLPEDAEPVRLRVRDIAADPVARSVFVLLANPGEMSVDLDGLRLNGRTLDLGATTVTIPPHKQVRLWLRGVDNLDRGIVSNISLVIESDGRWLQGYEVAMTPPFSVDEWNARGEAALHFSASGPFQRHGGHVVDLVDDFPTAERQLGLPSGSYLGTLQGRLIDVLDRDKSAGAGSTAIGYSRPHSFVALGEGFRPASHYVYGRLTDFVGVKGFDIQLFGGSLQDVLYWADLDRRIVEPHHVLAVPGAYIRKGARDGRPNEVELQQLVLTMLSVAPRGLLYFQREDTEDVFGFGSNSDFKRAISEVNRKILAVASDLRYAVPVKWVYVTNGDRDALDVTGSTGVFTLLSGADRLVVISLGYDRQARVKLPHGVAARPPGTELGDLPVDLIEIPARGGTGKPTPTIDVYDLTIDYRGDTDLGWFLF